MQEFVTDVAVSLDSWVGMVNMIKCRLLLRTKDGSMCYLNDTDASLLSDTRDARKEVACVVGDKEVACVVVGDKEILLYYCLSVV